MHTTCTQRQPHHARRAEGRVGGQDLGCGAQVHLPPAVALRLWQEPVDLLAHRQPHHTGRAECWGGPGAAWRASPLLWCGSIRVESLLWRPSPPTCSRPTWQDLEMGPLIALHEGGWRASGQNADLATGRAGSEQSGKGSEGVCGARQASVWLLPSHPTLPSPGPSRARACMLCVRQIGWLVPGEVKHTRCPVHNS